MNGNAQTPQKTEGRDDDRTRWPWPAQFALAVIALATAVFLLIWIPMRAAPGLLQGSSAGVTYDFSMMMAVFVGLTTITVSGIFLFMTFRIDRGTRTKAREVAEKAAIKAAQSRATEVAKKVAENEINSGTINGLKTQWEEHIMNSIKGDKDKLRMEIEFAKRQLSKQMKDSEKMEKELTELKNRAAGVVDRLENQKDAKIDEMEAIKGQAERDLKKIGEDGGKSLETIREEAGRR